MFIHPTSDIDGALLAAAAVAVRRCLKSGSRRGQSLQLLEVLVYLRQDPLVFGGSIIHLVGAGRVRGAGVGCVRGRRVRVERGVFQGGQILVGGQVGARSCGRLLGPPRLGRLRRRLGRRQRLRRRLVR